mmetsp:Transcript_122768/g.342073  ORF Transcript_122768/g.342073 Transcript_122768/m.342073 type:complete len:253 (+) Transcript_122768:133-891(+)
MAEALAVSAVKELQRTDPDAREQWRVYCDAFGSGIKDPAKHHVDFVQSFIDKYNGGQRFDASMAAVVVPNPQVNLNSNLALLFKEGQRKSQHFRNSWSTYCQHYGGGRNDPEKHEVSFLAGFLDFLGQRGNMALAMLPPPPTAVQGAGAFLPPTGPPVKRQRLDAMGVVGAMGTTPGLPGAYAAGPGVLAVQTTGDPVKDALVARIKAYQRSSEDARVHWSAHCDQQLGGVRDPARHDVNTLQMFIASYGVP